MGTSGTCLDKGKQSAIVALRDTVDLFISTCLKMQTFFIQQSVALFFMGNVGY